MDIQKKPPFETEFGGYKIIQRDKTWLYCVEKNMKIGINLLQVAFKSTSKVLGKKEPVGLEIVQTGKDRMYAHMWRDENSVHIECLSEPTVSFNKKYQQLIKHLNGK